MGEEPRGGGGARRARRSRGGAEPEETPAHVRRPHRQSHPIVQRSVHAQPRQLQVGQDAGARRRRPRGGGEGHHVLLRGEHTSARGRRHPVPRGGSGGAGAHPRARLAAVHRGRLRQQVHVEARGVLRAAPAAVQRVPHRVPGREVPLPVWRRRCQRRVHQRRLRAQRGPVRVERAGDGDGHQAPGQGRPRGHHRGALPGGERRVQRARAPL
mmetsp:Transcript_5161/g.9802  ORF Transcript_5161/g.9802 Transcript_5161/m.9802 type:complete len:212 (+) Transcript_5161:960-1595(+)